MCGRSSRYETNFFFWWKWACNGWTHGDWTTKTSLCISNFILMSYKLIVESTGKHPTANHTHSRCPWQNGNSQSTMSTRGDVPRFTHILTLSNNRKVLFSSSIPVKLLRNEHRIIPIIAPSFTRPSVFRASWLAEQRWSELCIDPFKNNGSNNMMRRGKHSSRPERATREVAPVESKNLALSIGAYAHGPIFQPATEFCEKFSIKSWYPWR